MPNSAAIGSEKFIRNGNITLVVPALFHRTATTARTVATAPTRLPAKRATWNPSTASASSPTTR